MHNIKSNNDIPAKEHEFIFGLTEDGTKVTLYINRCLSNHYTSISFYEKTIYTTKYAFFGAYFHSTNELEFHAVSIQMPCLEDFIIEPTLEEDSSKDGSKINFNYLSYKYKILSPDKEEFFLKIENIIEKESSSFHNLNFKSTKILKLEHNELKNYQWFYKKILILRNFIALCIGNPVNISCINFKINNEKICIIFNQGIIFSDEVYFTTNTFHLIKDNAEYIINNWFNNYTKLKTIYDLFFTTFYTHKLSYMEFKFLSLVQGIEAYHREKIGEQKFINKKDTHWKNLTANIKNYIISQNFSFSTEQSQFIINYMNNMPDITLKQRIQEILNKIIDSYHENSSIYKIPSDKDLITEIAKNISNCRNNLSHANDDEKRKKPEIPEFSELSDILQIILTYFFFLDSGLENKKIIELINNRYYGKKESLK